MSDTLNQKDVDSLIRRTGSGGSVTSNSLTQREIDAILQKTTPVPLAPMASDEVVPYNFSRPPRVSKDRRANLESIYQRYALSIQGLLGSMLRTPVDVVVNSVEQAMFSEFVLSLGRPCATYVFVIGDRLGGEGALDLSTDLAYHIVDRLFGGPGDAIGLNRPLTALEQGVVRNFAERSLAALRQAWTDHLTFAPEVRGFESNPDMLQITSREDNVLVASFEVRSATFQGFLSVCLPMASLEEFLQDKGAGRTQAARSTDSEAEQQRRLAAQAIQFAHVQASARLPQIWLPARALAELRPGHVLQTGQPADAPIELHLNGRLRFHGSLGQVRRHLGLRISERVHRPESERPARTRQGRVL